VNLISIPSESCPHCKSKVGNCAVLVKEADTLRAWDIKVKEKDFIVEILTGNKPKEREAYVAHSFVCLQDKGKR
jgi:hypothetical protein